METNMDSNIIVKKSVVVILSTGAVGEITADLSSSDIIILSVSDGYESRSISIDRAVFKEFINAIEEV